MKTFNVRCWHERFLGQYESETASLAHYLQIACSFGRRVRCEHEYRGWSADFWYPGGTPVEECGHLPVLVFVLVWDGMGWDGIESVEAMNECCRMSVSP